VYVETDPGTVIWHNGLTVHRALANTSGHPRKVFTIVYFADGVKRGSLLSAQADVPHFVTDDMTQTIATGEPLASTRMPIVYDTSANGRSRL
jgi:ectoine hydroxylase-related dioxygenase (phytanoyl-CoA dioxygenase family)